MRRTIVLTTAALPRAVRPADVLPACGVGAEPPVQQLYRGAAAPGLQLPGAGRRHVPCRAAAGSGLRLRLRDVLLCCAERRC